MSNLDGWLAALAYLEKRFAEETRHALTAGETGRIREMAAHRRDAVSLAKAAHELRREIERRERAAVHRGVSNGDSSSE